MKFIHHIRDYRDTFASWKKAGKEFTADDFVKKVHQNYKSIRHLLGTCNDHERFMKAFPTAAISGF